MDLMTHMLIIYGMALPYEGKLARIILREVDMRFDDLFYTDVSKTKQQTIFPRNHNVQ